MTYTPDSWVILHINTPEGDVLHKVLAGWSGSYLYGASWKINSGITKIEEHEDHYSIYGYSGSVYLCHKRGEQLTGMMHGILEGFSEVAHQIPITDILEEYSGR